MRSRHNVDDPFEKYKFPRQIFKFPFRIWDVEKFIRHWRCTRTSLSSWWANGTTETSMKWSHIEIKSMWEPRADTDMYKIESIPSLDNQLSTKKQTSLHIQSRCPTWHGKFYCKCDFSTLQIRLFGDGNPILHKPTRGNIPWTNFKHTNVSCAWFLPSPQWEYDVLSATHFTYFEFIIFIRFTLRPIIEIAHSIWTEYISGRHFA